ncbi:MAG: DNA-binding transcriptional LysR family regulator [Zhongshania aliphaticivorans]|jgi:DNA-binding transcriptional LysR family regulator|uniref:LysR family transcriptional regulator n=1 Tax=Zhongshania aliphaticivorans TaxID=1470434 RepID=UPI0039E5F52B
MKTLNLQKLLHALIIAEECSLVAASKKLHITQSALTRSIKSLEEDLGLQIFRRKSTGVELTSEGEMVIARARELLEQAGQLQADSRALSSGARSIVAFGLDPIIAHHVLAEQLKGMIAESRLMQVQVKVESRSALLSLLLNESIDFFIADINDFKPVDVKDIQVKILLQLRGSFYVRKGHPLSLRKDVSRTEIYSYPILTPSNVHENTWEELRWHSSNSDEPERKQQLICPDIHVLKTVTINSDAVFASSDINVQRECEAGQLLRVDHRVSGDEDLRTIGLVTLKDCNLGIHAKDIMRSFADSLCEI